MKITFISDTHNKHKQIAQYLTGGDVLIHTGDFSSMGHKHEIYDFCKWFSSLNGYTYKILIAGNHDESFQNDPLIANGIVKSFNNIIYLQDSSVTIEGVKIYGTPWQPVFMNWAFNLPTGGEELKQKFSLIPLDTDILLTHCPPAYILDRVLGEYTNLGCERLRERISRVQPKINAFGHIHTAHGYIDKVWSDTNKTTHFINSCVLNDHYIVSYKPFTIDWNKETNEIIFLSY